MWWWSIYSSNANTSATVVSVRRWSIYSSNANTSATSAAVVNVCDNISGRQYIVAHHHVMRQHGRRGRGYAVDSTVVNVCIITTTSAGVMAVVEEADSMVVEEAVVEVCGNPHLDKGEVAPTLKNIW